MKPFRAAAIGLLLAMLPIGVAATSVAAEPVTDRAP